MARYIQLFQVDYEHDYFESGKCKVLETEPTENCRKLMKRHRLIFKPFEGGFEMIASLDDSEELLINIGKEEFDFQLILTDEEILNYTSLPMGYPTQLVLNTYNDNRQEELQFEFVKNEIVNANKPVFSLLKIEYDSEKWKSPWREEIGVPSTRFVMHLSAKKAIWNYFFLLSKNSDRYDLEINTDELEGDRYDDVAFEEPILIQIHDRETLRISSKEPISYLEEPLRFLELQNKGKELIKSLPNPIPRNESWRPDLQQFQTNIYINI